MTSEKMPSPLSEAQIRANLTEHPELPQDPEVAQIYLDEITKGGDTSSNRRLDLDELDENKGETVVSFEKVDERKVDKFSN